MMSVVGGALVRGLRKVLATDMWSHQADIEGDFLVVTDPKITFSFCDSETSSSHTPLRCSERQAKSSDGCQFRNDCVSDFTETRA